MTIALIAALDNKAADAAFLAARLRSHGHEVTIVDVGVLGRARTRADIDRRRVAAAGGIEHAVLVARGDRSHAVAVMAAGATAVLAELHAQGRLTGALAIGGGAGTSIGAAALRGLPLGLPKVILSTIAAADSGRFVGTSDIVMFPSIVDFAGINRISAITYGRAADALAGMVAAGRPSRERDAAGAPLVAATMFGVTTHASCAPSSASRRPAARS